MNILRRSKRRSAGLQELFKMAHIDFTETRPFMENWNPEFCENWDFGIFGRMGSGKKFLR